MSRSALYSPKQQRGMGFVLKTATQGLFSISAPLGDYGGENTVMKKIRVVTKAQYLVE